MYILPHFLAYSKYYFCPGVGLQYLGASQLTKKYFIGGIGGRYLLIYNRWMYSYCVLRILYLIGNLNRVEKYLLTILVPKCYNIVTVICYHTEMRNRRETKEKSYEIFYSSTLFSVCGGSIRRQ